MRFKSRVCAAAFAAWALAATGTAGAATLSPTTTTDNDADGCTLREAVQATNSDSTGSTGCVETGTFGSDVIELPAGTYVLTTGSLTKNSDASTGGDLTVTNTGPGAVAVDGNENSRMFFNNTGATLRLTGFTLQNGSVSSGSGGALFNFGDLVLTDMAVVDNVGGVTAGDGGGIAAFSSGTLDMTNVTVSGNRSEGNGGGIFSAGILNAKNVTVAGNTADTDNAGNGDGGGIYNDFGTILFNNSIFSGNTDQTGQAPDCAANGGITSQGYSLMGSAAGCTFTPAGSDIVGTQAQLGTAALNGGSSLTRALLPGSPGIDQGNPAAPGSGGTSCAVADQRGTARPRGTFCDMGAYEAMPPNAVTPGTVTVNKKKGTATLDVAVPYAGQLDVTGTGVSASKAAAFPVTAAGTVKVKIAAAGKQQKTLKKKGKVALTINLAFTPTNGTAGSATAQVTLRKKVKKKSKK